MEPDASRGFQAELGQLSLVDALNLGFLQGVGLHGLSNPMALLFFSVTGYTTAGKVSTSCKARLKQMKFKVEQSCVLLRKYIWKPCSSHSWKKDSL